jgi:hypothetical protein
MAQAHEAALGRSVMAIADIGREDVWAVLTGWLAGDELDGRRADRPHLTVALGIRETHIALIRIQPGALKALALGDPKSR